MKKNNITPTRPPLESLACVNPECEKYGKKGAENLIIRKVYGADKIRYLRCRTCQKEFSERKGTALWNTKVRESKAIAVAEHLAEGCSEASTARLAKVDGSVVKRLNGRLGEHGQAYHDQEVREVEATELQADERYGFAGNKANQVWEAELMDPVSKFILSHVQGRRDEGMIKALMQDGAGRLLDPQKVALFTDGLPAYKKWFPQIFGRPYHRTCQGQRGPHPGPIYRIPRTAAHVQIIKHRSGYRLNEVEVRRAHGSQKRVKQALTRLGYNVPNTSAIERRNATARLMSAHQNRKTLAFAKDSKAKSNRGWWATTVYNWCRSHRSLRRLLPEPHGRKKYQQRSPAMAIGLADRIFSIADILRTPVYPPQGWR